MSNPVRTLFARALLALATFPAAVQAEDSTLPAPPEGFDIRREGIEHGKLETVEYDSTTVGLKRKCRSTLRRAFPETRHTRFCTSCTASAATRMSGLATVPPV